MNKVNQIWDVKDVSTGSGAITEPVTLAEAQNYMRVNGFIDISGSVDVSNYLTDDDLITDLITEARETVEKYCGLSLVAKSLKVVFDNNAGFIELPQGPIGAVSSLTDDQGNDVTDYETIGNDFKFLKSPTGSGYTVQYEAGYSSVPKSLKNAILAQVAYLYMNRGDDVKDTGICENARKRANPYRRTSPLL